MRIKSIVFLIAIFLAMLIIGYGFQQNSLAAQVASLSFILLLGVMIFAGVLDGFNPCAFSTLLLWVGFLLNRFGTQLDREVTIKEKRKVIFAYAMIYSLGIFVTYFLLGMGLLAARELINPQYVAPVIQFFAFIVVILGALMMLDTFTTPDKQIMKMPSAFYPVVKKYGMPTTKLAAFGSGVAIGLCSVPCSGAIYLAALLMMQSEPFLERYTILFLYNVGFIAPVVIFALILMNKKLLQTFSKDFVSSKPVIKQLVAIMTMALGVLSIYLH